MIRESEDLPDDIKLKNRLRRKDHEYEIKIISNLTPVFLSGRLGIFLVRLFMGNAVLKIT